MSGLTRTLSGGVGSQNRTGPAPPPVHGESSPFSLSFGFARLKIAPLAIFLGSGHGEELFVFVAFFIELHGNGVSASMEDLK